MINIGICDDEQSICTMIHDICEEYLRSIYIEYNIVEFHSGEELLKYADMRLDIVYLDIEMGQVNGIEAMQKLLNKDTVWKIVFVSNHESAIWEAFGMKTLGFVRKSKDDKMILKYLDTVIGELEFDKSVVINDGGENKIILMTDLLYLHTEKGYTQIYTKSGMITMWDIMKNWMIKFSAFPLLRIHKSYVVNMYNIDKCYSEKIVLKSKDELPIGRKYKNEVEQIYTEYMIKRMRVGQ